MRSRGDVHHHPPHWSAWRRALQRRAHPHPLDDWLIEQANLRGFYGAFVAEPSGAPLDERLSLEDIVVGLCQPHAPADARALKLVLRILQSGRVDPRHLAWLARKERADAVLHWFLDLVPAPERTRELDTIATLFAEPPRGYRPPDYDYDPQRLIRRPASGRLRA